jgi:hypothetical protein
MDKDFLIHATLGMRVSGLKLWQKLMLLKNALESRSTKKTRRRFLLRLGNESKTVYSVRNPYFAKKI